MSAFNVILVGAGEINFGSVEGPWNHSLRLEKHLGSRLKVLSIIDPDTSKSQSRIQSKLSTREVSSESWSSTLCHSNPKEASAELGEDAEIHLIINGSPPHFRGSTQEGKDLDLILLECFPKAKGIFIEKPVSALEPEQSGIKEVEVKLREWMKESGGIVGVGYVLRYLKAVQKMRSIISSNSLTPMLISARYYMAYEFATKLSWWNKTISCGPVVEQATHFVDLLRYFGGEVQVDTIQTQTVEHFEIPGQLKKLGFDESSIKEEDRIPRSTVSTFKFESGGLGQLNHVVGLHGNTYDTEFELVADGWVFRLKGAYSSSPRLFVRELGAVEEVEEVFEGDDPFLSEIVSMVDSIDAEANGISKQNGHTNGTGTESSVLSSFDDALRTYEVTWAIRKKGEETVLKNKKGRENGL